MQYLLYNKYEVYMKKKILTNNFLWVIIIGFFLGFFWVGLIHRGIFEIITDSITMVAWWMHILLVLAAFVLGITVHELGHLFSCIFNKIKVKAVYIVLFVFVKKKIWTIKILPKFLLLLGGAVLPIIDNVTNDDEFEKIRYKVSKVIGSGPITSLVYMILVVLLLLVSLSLSWYLLAGILFWFTIMTVLLTVIIFMASKVSYKGLYGDFVARSKILNDEIFAVDYLYSSSILVENKTQEKFFWSKIVDILESHNFNQNIHTKNLTIVYLEGVLFEAKEESELIKNKMATKQYFYNKNEEDMILNYLLALYFINTDSVKNQFIIEKITQTKYEVDDKVKVYWQKLYNHLTLVEDNTEFLESKKNYYPTSTEWLYSPINDKITIPTFELIKKNDNIVS